MPLARKRVAYLFEVEDLERVVAAVDDNVALTKIDELNTACEERFRGMLIRQDNLNRSLVSFHANKERPV